MGDEVQENATNVGAGTEVTIAQATLMWDAPNSSFPRSDDLKPQKARSKLGWKRVG
jgi:hypothetical protein